MLLNGRKTIIASQILPAESTSGVYKPHQSEPRGVAEQFDKLRVELMNAVEPNRGRSLSVRFRQGEARAGTKMVAMGGLDKRGSRV